jgi:hypothetical protein
LRCNALRVLDDGTYDVIVVDVVDAQDAGHAGGALVLSLTVIAGAHRGEVVDVRAEGLGRHGLDLIGMPGTLAVRDGAPSVTIDE